MNRLARKLLLLVIVVQMPGQTSSVLAKDPAQRGVGNVTMYGQYVPPVPEQIVAQTRRCLSIPGTLNHGSFKARLIAQFRDGMVTGIKEVEVDPPGKPGQSLIAATERALLRCGPYPDAPDGAVTLVFESEE